MYSKSISTTTFTFIAVLVQIIIVDCSKSVAIKIVHQETVNLKRFYQFLSIFMENRNHLDEKYKLMAIQVDVISVLLHLKWLQKHYII